MEVGAALPPENVGIPSDGQWDSDAYDSRFCYHEHETEHLIMVDLNVQ